MVYLAQFKINFSQIIQCFSRIFMNFNVSPKKATKFHKENKTVCYHSVQDSVAMRELLTYLISH